MNWKHPLLVLHVVLSFLLVTAGNALATTSYVEGEARNADAGPCASDGESMATVNGSASRGGAALFSPHNGCWARWQLTCPAGEQCSVWVGAIAGGGALECVTWVATIDGLPFGETAPYMCNGERGERQFLVGLGLVPVFSGTHTLNITAVYNSGPLYANTYIDYLKLVGG